MTLFDGRHSDALHKRVQCFIDACMHRRAPSETFDELACDLARMQAQACTGLEKLLARRGLRADELRAAEQIPAVPTDVFKLRRVACHPASLDQAVFRTSGTTVGARGEHAMRTTDSYRFAALAWGRAMLFPDCSQAACILLADPSAQDSSLRFMLAEFAQALGGNVTWGVDAQSLQVEGIREAVRKATDKGEPVLVAGASFAFVHLLDHLDAPIALPAGSRIMQTGGFKGRSREVDATVLRQQIAEAFGVGQTHVVGEYGMTELSSQAYEAGPWTDVEPTAARPGVYFAPGWMRVRAVDPQTLEPVAAGEPGLARIEDLANVDSAVVIQTADRVRVLDQGFELLGREPQATPRGCSIGIDEILS